jgi:hypothetical protein
MASTMLINLYVWWSPIRRSLDNNFSNLSIDDYWNYHKSVTSTIVNGTSQGSWKTQLEIFIQEFNKSWLDSFDRGSRLIKYVILTYQVMKHCCMYC